MSTEFMFLFCSKCKHLRERNEHLSPILRAFYTLYAAKAGFPSGIGHKKSPAAHCIFGAQGLGLSKALMSTVLRRQILSEINGTRPSSFRVWGKFSAIDILINDASFLAKRCRYNQIRLCFRFTKAT
ncbi:hypothetical protein [Brucella inopinata]|uniref:hypothetical protein n=1 Tax=Brucella inopinata TaxID=1218315 RepID=UPI0013142EE8|nr:hypothetical protein [Brucella inopinata]